MTWYIINPLRQSSESPDLLSGASIMAWSIVQEYERAVIFRLGRLVKGGARGPGVFFVIPCLDVYEKIDMRTSTYDVPPQEVITHIYNLHQMKSHISPDPHQRLRDGVRECHHVLQG